MSTPFSPTTIITAALKDIESAEKRIESYQSKLAQIAKFRSDMDSMYSKNPSVYVLTDQDKSYKDFRFDAPFDRYGNSSVLELPISVFAEFLSNKSNLQQVLYHVETAYRDAILSQQAKINKCREQIAQATKQI